MSGKTSCGAVRSMASTASARLAASPTISASGWAARRRRIAWRARCSSSTIRTARIALQRRCGDGELPGGPCGKARRSRSAQGDDGRAEAVRDPPRRARRAEGPAPGADRPASPAGPGQRRAGGREGQGDRLDPAGTERRSRPVEAEPGAFNRLTTLERDAARLKGERGALVASAAQARGRIAETELKILQIGEDLRTDVE